MIGYTYKLTLDKSPAYYIGVTQKPKARLASHKSELKRGIHRSHMFQKAWDESGSTVVSMQILHQGPMSEAMEKEVGLLKSSATDPLLKNTCVSSANGIDVDRLADPEAHLRIKSEAFSGAKNPMFGRTHTPEARKAISEKLMGKNLGVKRGPMSEEQRKKLSESRLVNPPVGEKNPFFGKQHSEETKAKIREKNKGQLPPNTKSTIIDGVEYKSQAAAAAALGVSHGLIGYRLRNPSRYPNYQSKTANE